jgi:hypothetical protein
MDRLCFLATIAFLVVGASLGHNQELPDKEWFLDELISKLVNESDSETIPVKGT